MNITKMRNRLRRWRNWLKVNWEFMVLVKLGLKSKKEAYDSFIDYLLEQGYVYGGVYRFDHEPKPEEVIDVVYKEYLLKKKILGKP